MVSRYVVKECKGVAACNVTFFPSVSNRKGTEAPEETGCSKILLSIVLGSTLSLKVRVTITLGSTSVNDGAFTSPSISTVSR